MELTSWKESRRRFEERQDRIEEQRVAGTSPSLELEGYAGTYGGDMYGDATVTLEGDHLVLRLLPNPDLTADLEHLHFDTFVIRWRETFAWFGKGTATFVLDASGNVNEMKLAKAELEGIRHAHPNVAEVVRDQAFKAPHAGS